MEDLIVVRQLPVIEEQLIVVKERIEARVNEALSMACTADTYKEVKRIRSELNREFGEIETRRKEVKAAILAPYDRFELAYKQYVGSIYTKADTVLKTRIAEVEKGLKQQKEDDLHRYFDEYRESLSIPRDLVALEDTGIRVGLSDSKKTLRSKAKDFLDRVHRDLALIETQEYKDEILVEYRKCLDVSRAVTEVNDRRKAVEEERQRREAEAILHTIRENAAATVEAIASETAEEEPNELVTAPVVIRTETSTDISEKVYVTTFRVTEKGTAGLEKLRNLKFFLNEGGYNYEQL